MNGKINSFQSMGAVDGPGLRYVIFMQGCPLRCVYCHNPETWDKKGEEYSIDQVMDKILRCKPYIQESGGVTVSGGEPLLQWEFVEELFSKLKKEGIHTSLDTSGIGSLEGAEAVLEFTDLVICDLKFSSSEEYLKYCNADFKRVLEFLELTERMKIPLWIRHVVVPNLTDGEKNIINILKVAKKYKNLEKFELLPFKKICISKYKTLGLKFALKSYEECSEEKIKNLYDLIKDI